MIVQTIEISLSKGRAPELLAHLGESNRQIEMIPDVTLPETAGAEIDIVKPDGTFAIQTAAITDGHIIVTLPDQACTVKGLSHYILKITDTGTVIYSAYGNIFVDDHLITDELIESVAEVNGYVFPDDFALKSEIQNPINDEEISTEKAWSSSKINSIVSYSTNETKIGNWIDGREMYHITKQVIGPFTSNQWYSIDLGTGKEIVEIINCVFIAQNGTRVPLFYYRSNNEYCTGDSYGSVFEYIHVGLNSTVSVEVTLRYVKEIERSTT